MTRRGRLLVISAPSGCGKTTLCEKLMASRLGLVRSVSMTTRAPRDHEAAGRDYFFVTRREFLRRRGRGEFLEWANVYGDFYGTPRAFIETAIARGRDVLLSIDVQGARQVRKKFPGARLIFILPPSLAALRRRLLGRRTESAAVARRRLAWAKRELGEAGTYDYCVVNDRLPKALEHLKAIVVAERCRRSACR